MADDLYNKLTKRFNDLGKVYKMMANKQKKFYMPLKVVTQLIRDVYKLIKWENYNLQIDKTRTLVHFTKDLGNYLGKYFYEAKENLVYAAVLPYSVYKDTKITKNQTKENKIKF